MLPGPAGGEVASNQDYDLLIRRLQREILFQLPEKDSNRYSLALYSAGGCLIRQWETVGSSIECKIGTLESGTCLVRLCHGDDVETFHIQV